MGMCQSKNKEAQRLKKVVVTCLICDFHYDTKQHRPYVICSNQHQICEFCLKSIKKHRHIRKQVKIVCPFCKEPIKENDPNIYQFLKNEEDNWDKMAQNRKKLYAFSSIYIPKVHQLMKASAEDKNNQYKLQNIDLIRIKGRMLEQYQVFEMEIFQCLPALRKIYLNNNHIKMIDIGGYSHNKLQLLDLSGNQISSIIKIFQIAENQFKHLKIINLKKNNIAEIGGLQKYQYLQTVIISYNQLKNLDGLKCKQLKHLNAQFNQIDDNIMSFQYFTQLRSLRLYGNHLGKTTWNLFILQPWNNLKVLTASTSAIDFLERQQMRKQISSIKSKSLKFIVFQLQNYQAENLKEASSQKILKQISKGKVQHVQLHSQTYQFLIQNNSFLRECTQSILKHDHLGLNINFKPKYFNKNIYSENDAGNGYIKTKDSYDTGDYLYSKPIISSKSKSLYMTILFKNRNLIVGVCQMIAQGRSVELNLQTMNLTSSLESRKCDAQLDFGQSGCQISVCLNLLDQKVQFYNGKTKIEQNYLHEKWNQFKFFININDKYGQVNIVRSQYDNIE